MTLAQELGAISVDASAGMLALVTATAAIVLGLGTLARPSRATIAWGLAYGIGLLGVYLWVAADQREDGTLRAIGSSLLLAFTPLVWLGLRLFFARRAPWWPVLLFLLVVPVVLGATATTPAYPIAFRIVFALSGVFAAFIAVELLRDRQGRRDIMLPLALAGCVFAIVSVLAAIGSFLPSTLLPAFAQLGILREVNSVGILIVSVCAAFTIVLLVRTDAATGAAGEAAAERARRRLLKAKSLRDPAWSVLDIRLDDPLDLRLAWTGATYERIVEAFHRCVIDELPPSADADRVADERVIVLIRDSKEAVQQMLRTLLARVSSIRDEDPNLEVRFSVSVGWAPAAPAGYDYDVLVDQAAQAVERARLRGGDCWERVGPTSS